MESANKNITYKISFTTTGGQLGNAEAQVKHPYRNQDDAVAKAVHLLESGLVHEAEVTKCESVFWQTSLGEVKPARTVPQDTLINALKAIASLGGNLTDAVLTSKSGTNDSVDRGIKYCAAREIALAAIAKAQ